MFDENGIYIYPVKLKILEDYQIILEFSNGQLKLFDCKYLLDKTIYAPLKDLRVFNSATINDEVLSWCDGELDIAPETLYMRSIKYSHPTEGQKRDIQLLNDRFGRVA